MLVSLDQLACVRTVFASKLQPGVTQTPTATVSQSPHRGVETRYRKQGITWGPELRGGPPRTTECVGPLKLYVRYGQETVTQKSKI